MRKTIIAGNWKMNHTGAEVRETLSALIGYVADKGMPEVIVAPVFPYLGEAVSLAKETGVRIAAQNMHWKDSGAYTGEVSPAMLVDVGVSHVILGHSERRTYFNETDGTVNLKVKAALARGLMPVLCCGETLEQRERGSATAVIEAQIATALDGINREEIDRIIVAYEPVWAIGTGKTAGVAEAQEACSAIRRKIAGLYGKDLAAAVSVLYGGSVKAENIAALTSAPDIDGGLVGGASLKADDFAAIIQHAVIK